MRDDPIGFLHRLGVFCLSPSFSLPSAHSPNFSLLIPLCLSLCSPFVSLSLSHFPYLLASVLSLLCPYLSLPPSLSFSCFIPLSLHLLLPSFPSLSLLSFSISLSFHPSLSLTAFFPFPMTFKYQSFSVDPHHLLPSKKLLSHSLAWQTYCSATGQVMDRSIITLQCSR